MTLGPASEFTSDVQDSFHVQVPHLASTILRANVIFTSLTVSVFQNGQDTFDSLNDLKPALVERHERWLAAHPNAVDLDPTHHPALPSNPLPTSAHREDVSRTARQSDPHQRANDPYSRMSPDDARRAQAQADARQRIQQENAMQERVAGELELWKRQREQFYVDDRGTSDSGSSRGGDTEMRRREATRQRELDLTFSRPQGSNSGDYGHREIQGTSSLNSYEHAVELERRRAQQQQQQQQQQDMRRREEDDAARRQRERKHSGGPSSSSSAMSSHHNHQTPSVSTISSVRAPTAVSSRPPSFLDTYPQVMPLESPTRYDGDSTDSEAMGDGRFVWRHARTGKYREGDGAPSQTHARR